MASRFEDIIAWQKARVLTKVIYETTRQGELSKDFGLRDQIRRASVSIMSNIAEGFERGSTADYARFLQISKASCGEVRCQLYIALDVGYIDKELFTTLYQQATEVSRIIGGIIRSLDSKRKREE